MIRFQFENINIKIDNTIYFENISYEFFSSKFYLILGDNNSGKTLLLNSLLENKNIYSGIIRINNILTTSYQASKEGIYLLNQNPIYFKSLSILENLYPDNYQKSEKLLEKFKIKINLNLPLFMLNEKELFKISFIRYLTFNNLSLLLIDDFSLLKIQENKEFFNCFFNELKSRNISVVIVDYQISSFYINFIDEILLINKKKLEIKSKDEYIKNHLNTIKKNNSIKLNNIISFEKLKFQKNHIYGIICNNKNKKKSLTEYLMNIYPNSTIANLNSMDSLFTELNIFENTVVSSKRNKYKNTIIKFFEFINLKNERKKISSLIKKLNLSTQDIYTNINELGLGDQKKIILARYLLSNYDFLILFNLFNSIDNPTKVDIINLLFQYSKRDKTVIILDNNLQGLNMVCNKIFNII